MKLYFRFEVVFLYFKFFSDLESQKIKILQQAPITRPLRLYFTLQNFLPFFCDHVKKFQSTHQITIQKGPKKPVKLQASCGRSHSTGSDLSAGCSASNCQATQLNRVCSHDSDNSNNNVSEINNDSDSNTQIASELKPAHDLRRFSNNQDFKKPDAELTKKLIELIEFYLSDEYLAKDKYLLRQIRCKSEGYISIKLMTSFKKVKKLTRDWRSVRFALQQSPNLIVSPEGFRVKRSTQLPENLRKPRLLSSVVTIRLTEELSSVDAITNMFSKYGEIGLVRILKPGKEIPSDLRNYATQVPDIGKTMCAVVDFEQSESALQAVRLLKDELVEHKMRLALLGPRVRRTLYKQDKSEDEDEEDNDDLLDDISNVEPEKEVAEHLSNITSSKSTMSTASSDKISLKNTSSNESNSTTNTHSLDLSVDSGNCHASGHTSENESLELMNNKMASLLDMANNNNNMTNTVTTTTFDENSKSPLLKRDSNNNNNNQNNLVILNKISTIFREPEGPGSNPEMNGFAIKRSDN